MENYLLLFKKNIIKVVIWKTDFLTFLTPLGPKTLETSQNTFKTAHLLPLRDAQV